MANTCKRCGVDISDDDAYSWSQSRLCFDYEESEQVVADSICAVTGEPQPGAISDDIPFNALNGQLAHLI